MDEHHNIHIADFGLSFLSGDKRGDVGHEISLPHASRGAMRWLAPEDVFNPDGRTKHMPGNIYALACAFLEVSSSISVLRCCALTQREKDFHRGAAIRALTQ